MPETIWHLNRCELFQRLTPEELRRLESRSRSRIFAAKSPIYVPGEKSESVFLVAQGIVKVSSLRPDGKESILTFIDQGELFGELALLDVYKQGEFVEAVERTKVVMMPADLLRQIVAGRSDLALEITKLVGMRRLRIERRLRHLLFRSSRERLIHLLLDLEEQFGEDSERGTALRLRLSHQDLANLIGATRETVTVNLGQLRSEGMIECQRCKIMLLSPARLAKLVHRQRQPKAERISPEPQYLSALSMI